MVLVTAPVLPTPTTESHRAHRRGSGHLAHSLTSLQALISAAERQANHLAGAERHRILTDLIALDDELLALEVQLFDTKTSEVALGRRLDSLAAELAALQRALRARLAEAGRCPTAAWRPAA